MRIEGKVALVTGGASGLGRATAGELYRAGASVVILDIAPSGEQAAEELGEHARFCPGDIASEDDVGRAVTAAVEAFGGLHIVVSCAGIGWAQRVVQRSGPHPLEVFAKVIEVNLIGTFNVLRLASAQMSSQEPDGEERGVLVMTSSIAAFDGQIGQVAYAASKGGIASMTLPVARDLAARRIRCVTIAPGLFETALVALVPEENVKGLVDQVPHPHRLGAPGEFAGLVRHIVENPMLNGETIRLDGAMRMAPR